MEIPNILWTKKNYIQNMFENQIIRVVFFSKGYFIHNIFLLKYWFFILDLLELKAYQKSLNLKLLNKWES